MIEISEGYFLLIIIALSKTILGPSLSRKKF